MEGNHSIKSLYLQTPQHLLTKILGFQKPMPKKITGGVIRLVNMEDVYIYIFPPEIVRVEDFCGYSELQLVGILRLTVAVCI